MPAPQPSPTAGSIQEAAIAPWHGLVPPGTVHGLVPPGAAHGLVPPGTAHGLVPPGAAHGLVPPGAAHDPSARRTAMAVWGSAATGRVPVGCRLAAGLGHMPRSWSYGGVKLIIP